MASFGKVSCSRKIGLPVNNLYCKSIHIANELREFPQLSSCYCSRHYVPFQLAKLLIERRFLGRGKGKCVCSFKMEKAPITYLSAIEGKEAASVNTFSFFLHSGMYAPKAFLKQNCCDVYHVSQTKCNNFVFHSILL